MIMRESCLKIIRYTGTPVRTLIRKLLKHQMLIVNTHSFANFLLGRVKLKSETGTKLFRAGVSVGVT